MASEWDDRKRRDGDHGESPWFWILLAVVVIAIVVKGHIK